MRGNLRKRAKDSWTAQVYLGRDPMGKKRYKSITVKGTKRDAERVLNDTLNRIGKNAYVEPTKITFGEYLRQWLRDYAEVQLRPRTVQGYRGMIEAHMIPMLGRIPLTRLTSRDIQQYEATLLRQGRYDGRGGLSAQSVLHHHRLLFTVLRHAVRSELMVRNVAEAIVPPRPVRYEHRVLGWPELQSLLDACQHTPYYHIFGLALQTGLRRSEILALRWQDLDLIHGTVMVIRAIHQLKGAAISYTPPKTGRGRKIPLPRPAREMLRAHREHQEADAQVLGISVSDESLVFTRPDGSPMRPNTITRAFADAVKRAGLDGLRLHDLRHTHASLLLSQGTHTKIVSERLGHSTIAITADLYSHLLPGIQEEAADVFGDTWDREIKG